MIGQRLAWMLGIALGVGSSPVLAEPLSRSAADLYPLHLAEIQPTDAPKSNPPETTTPSSEDKLISEDKLDLDPQLLRSSPVLQRWRRQIPNVMRDIQRDPSFRSRLRLGYVNFPSTRHASGWQVGVEDVLIGRSALTVSADYAASFDQRRQSWGADARYYLLPLGSVVNIAPVLGYRSLTTRDTTLEGLNLGVRLLLVPSRPGAADISLTQSWVSPGQSDEFGQTTLSVGYALSHHLRLSTDIQKQNSRLRQDSRVGIALEWMF